MKLWFGTREVQDGDVLPAQTVTSTLSFEFKEAELNPLKYYTVLLYELSHKDPNKINIIGQKSNIRNFDITIGTTLVSVDFPKQFSRTKTYVFELDEQDRIIPPYRKDAKDSTIEEIRKVYGLTHIETLRFYVVPPKELLILGNNCGCERKESIIKKKIPKKTPEKIPKKVFGVYNQGDQFELGVAYSGSSYEDESPIFYGYDNRSDDEDIFLPNSPLSEADRKYCRCTLKVAAKNPEECKRNWKRPGCVNPYAVCHARVKGESGFPHCSHYFDFRKMSDEELRGFVKSRAIPKPSPESIPESVSTSSIPTERKELIRWLESWRSQKTV